MILKVVLKLLLDAPEVLPDVLEFLEVVEVVLAILFGLEKEIPPHPRRRDVTTKNPPASAPSKTDPGHQEPAGVYSRDH